MPSPGIVEAAKLALQCQNACNLSGVVHDFSRILTEVLWPAARSHGEGTDWVNRHPIAVLFAYKIAHLTGLTRDLGEYEDALRAVRRYIKVHELLHI